MPAAQIASELRVSVKKINAILYKQRNNKYVMMSTENAPLWILKDGAQVIVDSGVVIFESLASATPQIPWDSCTVCGMTSNERFCSGRCRGTAMQALAVEQLRVPNFENSSSFLRYVLRNPTAQFPWAGEPPLIRNAPKRPNEEMTLLELWEASNRNWQISISHLRGAFDAHKTTLKTITKQSNYDPKIALSLLRGKNFQEIIAALAASGVETGRPSVVSMRKLENLKDISGSARKQILQLETRRRSLTQNMESRLIDSFTLQYFGVSKSLYETINVHSPLSFERIENKFAHQSTGVDATLKEEFAELLLAIAQHPIVPNESLLENLEIRFPQILLLTESHYRRRLLQILHQNPVVKISPSRTRLIRLIGVVELIGKGQTLNEIGKELGVSRERVRQLLEPIIAEFGVGSLSRLRGLARSEVVLQSSNQFKKLQGLVDEISMFIRAHPGICYRELIEVFPKFDNEIQEAVRRHPALILDQFPIAEEPEFEEREDILESLRSASLLKYPLSGVAYDQLLVEGFVKGVSRMRILQVYGSWTAACERAAVESGEALKNVEYVRRYSQYEMLRVVGSFLLDDDLEGGSGAMHKYEPWKGKHELADSVPSSGTIRNYISASWIRVRQVALAELRKSWDTTVSDH